MKLRNSHVSVDVQPNGAAVAWADFTLKEGKTVNPFVKNPWREDSNEKLEKLPPLLRHLAGEWPCVPFGSPGLHPDLPEEWQLTQPTDPWNSDPHGYCSNHVWDLHQETPSQLSATISYPDYMPVSRMARTIQLDPEQPRINFSLTVEARQNIRLPIALHPIFDLTDCPAQSCKLQISGQDQAWTLPTDLEPESIFLPDQRGISARNVPLKNGHSLDATQVPFRDECEDLLMLTIPDGRVALEYPHRGYRVVMQWDTNALPSCIVWFSNGGRKEYPWNGRIRAIGIEPVAGAFDLGTSYAQAPASPLTKAGIVNGIDLTPERPWSLNYSISVEDI